MTPNDVSDRRPTTHDVARRAGVSQSTVSRALRSDPRVSQETRERIRAAAEAIGYYASTSASVSRTVGVVVSDITNPYYPALLDVLQTELSFLGFKALLFNERTAITTPPSLMEQLERKTVDGLLLTSAGVRSSVPQALADRGMPIVLLNRLVDDADLDSVSADNVSGGRLAAEHLVGLGHDRIGIIGGPSDISTHRDRHRAFIDEVVRLGRSAPVEARGVASTYSHETGYQDCLGLLSLADPPSAIFCTNDLMAYGVLSAAQARGLRVPDDLSVIGFDDNEMSSWGFVDLTTIHHPIRLMAKQASQLLIERLGGLIPEAPRNYVFPVRLIHRGTTAPLQSS